MSFLTLFLRELCLKKLGITTQSRLMLEMISCFVSNKAKSRISKRVLQKNKEPQIFRKTNISYPLIRTRTCPYQGGEKCSFFFGKFGVLCFLITPILRFAYLPYCRRIHIFFFQIKKEKHQQVKHMTRLRL